MNFILLSVWDALKSTTMTLFTEQTEIWNSSVKLSLCKFKPFFIHDCVRTIVYLLLWRCSINNQIILFSLTESRSWIITLPRNLLWNILKTNWNWETDALGTGSGWFPLFPGVPPRYFTRKFSTICWTQIAIIRYVIRALLWPNSFNL